MLLAAVFIAGEAEAAAADVMRCSTGMHLCGATRPAVDTPFPHILLHDALKSPCHRQTAIFLSRRV